MSITDTPPLLEGKVAEILSHREVVINVGAKNGVRRGMRFRILAESTHTIRDPDTGHTLGELAREKARVVVNQVEEAFAICKTYRETVVPELASVPSPVSISAYSEGGDVNVRWEQDHQGDESVFRESVPPLPDDDSYVKVGDRMVQLPNND